MFSIAKRLSNTAQDCSASRLRWGKLSVSVFNPEGVAFFRGNASPLGLESFWGLVPRVAAKRGNPGLYDVTASR